MKTTLPGIWGVFWGLWYSQPHTADKRWAEIFAHFRSREFVRLPCDCLAGSLVELPDFRQSSGGSPAAPAGGGLAAVRQLRGARCLDGALISSAVNTLTSSGSTGVPLLLFIGQHGKKIRGNSIDFYRPS